MIAIHPPAYFPGLRYMALMQCVDCFVLADTFRYSRRSSPSRARLRNPNGWQWITVPLQAHQQDRPICEVAINEDDPWRGKHWRAFQYNYRSTPYFEFFESQVEPFFEREWESLGELTTTSIQLMHDMLGLSTTVLKASSLAGAPDTIEGIMAQVDEAVRVAGVGGHEEDGIEEGISVFHFEAPTYHQNFAGFEPDMSAVDLIFNYGPEARSLLAQHARIEPPPNAD